MGGWWPARGMAFVPGARPFLLPDPWQAWLLGPARAPVGLTTLESPSEERDLGYFFSGGGAGRMVGDSLPAWAMASWAPGVRREKDKGKRGFNRV